MVQDEKRVTLQDQIDERVRVNRCRDLTVVNDPPSFVRMTCMRTFQPSRWSRLDLEYRKDFPDSSLFLAANVTIAMRFGAVVAATMMEIRQRAFVFS